MLVKPFKFLAVLFFSTSFFIACNKTEATVDTTTVVDTIVIDPLDLAIANPQPKQLIGANALHSFAAGSSDMNAWNMDIAREFVGNVKEEPLTNTVIKDSNGAWLHGLQRIVDSNRLNKRITILCAFGWDGKTLFTGLRPSQQSFYAAFKTKLAQWAVQFKNQPDVWIEVWNEPYAWNRTDGYTDNIWVSDMNDLVSVVRNAGNNNTLLVPCAEQGQDESVLINKGQSFLSGKKNIVFDIHAYEKWMLTGNANIGTRLEALKQKNLPVFFGEAAPVNSSGLMNPKPFIDSIYNRGLSVCAWAWKYDETESDALLTKTGAPNNNNNNNWGTLYKTLAARPRK